MKDNLKLIPEVFFDFLSYFLPGALLIIMLINKSSILSGIIKNTYSFREGLIIVFCGYFCGHLLTTLSSLFIVKPLNYFFGNPIHTLIGINDKSIFESKNKLSDDIILKIRSIAQKEFSLNIDKHTFFLCENFIRINYPDIGFLIRKRHAFEHLCRNVTLAAILLFFFIEGNKVLFILIALLSFIRYLDYRVSWPKVVYENFLLFSLENVSGKEENKNSS